MNREILFRGKRIDNREWVYGFYVGCGRIAQIQTFSVSSRGICLGNAYAAVPATVGQYTGLTDKNGVKIFEGDLLNPPDDEIDKAVAEFAHGAFRLSLYGVKGALMEYGWDETAGGYGIFESEPLEFCGVSDCEVIGNIFDKEEQCAKTCER